MSCAVRVAPAGATQDAVVLHAGECARFDDRCIDAREPLRADDAAWADGQIVASAMRLADFLSEVGRYRRGVVRYDTSIAGLRLSGSYPLDDTDRIFAALTNALPVRVEYMTRYWVTLHPASA